MAYHKTGFVPVLFNVYITVQLSYSGRQDFILVEHFWADTQTVTERTRDTCSKWDCSKIKQICMWGKQTANHQRHNQDYTGAVAGGWVWGEKKSIAAVKEHKKVKNLMLIMCVTTKLKTTPAVKWWDSQSSQRGNNKKAIGEEAEQLPKTHSCLTGSVHDLESFIKILIHHFWGGMKITKCYITPSPCTACCPAQHGMHCHQENAGWAASLCPSMQVAAMPFMSTPPLTTSSYSASQDPTAHTQHWTIMLAGGMVSAPKSDSYWLW